MAGIKVLELASVLAGPTVSQFLSELGAEVIKVENTTTKGDVTRTWRLERDSDDTSVTAYFSCCNVGKRSLALNLRDSRGLNIVHKMVKEADIVIASYKPGDAEKLQVDYNTLSAINPSLVYGQITGYGLDDSRSGYDAVIQAESGFQYMNGDKEPSLPTKMPVAFMDLLAAHQLKEGILASMWEREKSGEGSYISVSLMGAGVSALANQATGYLKGGIIPQRMGSDHPSIVPYGSLFECMDGKLITLAIGNDKQFRNLCKVLGNESLSFDVKYKTNPNRVQNRDECKNILGTLIKKFNRKELLNMLHMKSIPAGGVNNMKDVFEQKQAEELVVRDGNGVAMGVKQVAFSRRGSNGDDGDDFVMNQLVPPPEYGQHTKEILSNYMNSDEIDELLNDGVIEQR
jgi:crotonobetainyl-CoA:carnitine CoA-transferase CaiB-like acyl-CoA transferase